MMQSQPLEKHLGVAGVPQGQHDESELRALVRSRDIVPAREGEPIFIEIGGYAFVSGSYRAEHP